MSYRRPSREYRYAEAHTSREDERERELVVEGSEAGREEKGHCLWRSETQAGKKERIKGVGRVICLNREDKNQGSLFPEAERIWKIRKGFYF